MSFPTLTGDLSVQLRKITQLFMCHAPCGEEPFLRVSRWSVASGMRSAWTPGAPDSSRCNNQTAHPQWIFSPIFPTFAIELRISCSLLKSQEFKRQVSVERNGVFIRKSTNLGRRWTRVLRPTWKILLSHERILKGKMGDYLSDSLRHEVGFSMDPSSDVILPLWSASRVAKRALGSRELVIL